MSWGYSLHENPRGTFPVLALAGVALPLISVGIGVWAWRGNKVQRLTSGVAIAVGIAGLAIVAIETVVGLYGGSSSTT
jgi:hypothetical protein